jgi:hypothetical protein
MTTLALEQIVLETNRRGGHHDWSGADRHLSEIPDDGLRLVSSAAIAKEATNKTIGGGIDASILKNCCDGASHTHDRHSGD